MLIQLHTLWLTFHLLLPLVNRVSTVVKESNINVVTILGTAKSKVEEPDEKADRKQSI